MKLLIIGPSSKENLLLKKTAEIRGHHVLLTSLKKISFIIEKNQMKAFWQGEELKDYDLCLFRGIMPFMKKAKTFAKYLYFSKTKVIDKELYSRVYEFDKMFMSFELFQKDLPTIDTYCFSTFKEFKRHLVDLPKEVVIKDIAGMRSRNIFSFKTKKSLECFFEKNKKQVKKFLVQKKVEAKHYYRILIVGKKVLGAMKRISYFNPQRKDFSLSQRSSIGELNKELRQLALKAAKATNTDIAGVDIIESEKGYQVLEVNRSPQFKRFSQIMKVNVAEEIIKYLEKVV